MFLLFGSVGHKEFIEDVLLHSYLEDISEIINLEKLKVFDDEKNLWYSADYWFSQIYIPF